MNKIARILPLFTVIAWAITLVLPVLDSGNTVGPRIIVTSLGGQSFDLADVEPVFLLAWAGVLVCALSVWLLRSLRWWSLAAIATSGLLCALFVRMLTDPPMLMWDGVDPQGNPIGGAEIGEPAIGAVLWGIGIAALFVAGVCGFLGAKNSRKQPVTRGAPGNR